MWVSKSVIPSCTDCPPMKLPTRWILRWSLLAVVLVGMTGCKTTDDDMVERPWNAPKNWENGLPAGMMEGR